MTAGVVVAALAFTACSSSESGGGTTVPAAAPTTAAPTTSRAPATTAAASTTTGPTTAPPPTTEAPKPIPDPVTVTGPVEAATPMANAARLDLAFAAYTEEEYFISGDASSYTVDGERSTDGKWTAAPDDSAAFTTRIIVRRPAKAADFSGTVVVEWLNVSAGADGDPDWGYLHSEIIREGHAWVGVSAQAVGVSGGQPILASQAATGGLVAADPVRYGSLVHPGDRYSWDIYSHAAGALLNPDGPNPLGDLVPQQVIAAGESQSAMFLTSYINGVHPVAPIFDGFLVHSRAGGAPPFDGTAMERGSTVGYAIRDDLDVPVMIFSTETDLTVLGYSAARQDDTDLIRGWEVAGTAHADAYLLEEVYGVQGDASGLLNCPTTLNSGPHHEVLQAAFHHLVAWAAGGLPPPTSQRIELSSTDPAAIARDDRGNALGGIRTPLVDVPLATLSGDPAVEAGEGFCFLFGSTTPFDRATIRSLYPSRDAYSQAFATARDEAVQAGFVLGDDVEAMTNRALAKYDELAGNR